MAAGVESVKNPLIHDGRNPQSRGPLDSPFPTPLQAVRPPCLTLLLLHLLVIQPPLSTFSAASPERIITNPHSDDCDSPAISLSDSCFFPLPFFPSQPERPCRRANLMVSFPFLEPVACFPLPRGSPCRCLLSLTSSTLESQASWVPGTHPLLSPQDFPPELHPAPSV